MRWSRLFSCLLSTCSAHMTANRYGDVSILARSTCCCCWYFCRCRDSTRSFAILLSIWIGCLHRLIFLCFLHGQSDFVCSFWHDGFRFGSEQLHTCLYVTYSTIRCCSFFSSRVAVLMMFMILKMCVDSGERERENVCVLGYSVSIKFGCSIEVFYAVRGLHLFECARFFLLTLSICVFLSLHFFPHQASVRCFFSYSLSAISVDNVTARRGDLVSCVHLRQIIEAMPYSHIEWDWSERLKNG